MPITPISKQRTTRTGYCLGPILIFTCDLQCGHRRTALSGMSTPPVARSQQLLLFCGKLLTCSSLGLSKRRQRHTPLLCSLVHRSVLQTDSSKPQQPPFEQRLTCHPCTCLCRESVSSVVWSKDGAQAAVLTDKGIRLVDSTSLHTTADIPAPQTNAAAFSDSGELLLTHQRPFRQDGNPGKNLMVGGLTWPQMMLTACSEPHPTSTIALRS